MINFVMATSTDENTSAKKSINTKNLWHYLLLLITYWLCFKLIKFCSFQSIYSNAIFGHLFTRVNASFLICENDQLHWTNGSKLRISCVGCSAICSSSFKFTSSSSRSDCSHSASGSWHANLGQIFLDVNKAQRFFPIYCSWTIFLGSVVETNCIEWD